MPRTKLQSNGLEFPIPVILSSRCEFRPDLLSPYTQTNV